MMQTGQEKYGMQTFNQALADLYLRGLITIEQAMQSSSNKDELQDLIGRGTGANQSYGNNRPGGAGKPGQNPSPYMKGRPIGKRPIPR